MDFLTDNDIDFDLPALKAASTRFDSALAAARRALKSERDVAAQFDKMAAVAIAAGDHRGHQFLQWFIEEQVEEEAKLQAIVDLLDSGINLYPGRAPPGRVRVTDARRVGEPPLVTEAELQAVTVGPVEHLVGHVRLAEPDPAWPALYAREAARIRGLLGDDIRRLEHVGSTSVPGLAAKPIIDILLVVDDSGMNRAICPGWRPAGTSCGSANRRGTSTGCAKAPIRT